ncbi:hypothetical protein LZC95_52425 [Pendulispora brunnea]|uniref:Uncharacterized protein n=1 Tax=Pendulispora brunnea TaxID=2905690 RepID=A0ABZ2KF72_9BACT
MQQSYVAAACHANGAHPILALPIDGEEPYDRAMLLESPTPEWQVLHDCLADLAGACHARFAAVVDEGNGLWCVACTKGRSAGIAEDYAADRFYRVEIAPHAKEMRRGVHLSIESRDGDDLYVAESFAALYMLVVWFDGPFEPELVHARLRRALPKVEALTLSLPPESVV